MDAASASPPIPQRLLSHSHRPFASHRRALVPSTPRVCLDNSYIDTRRHTRAWARNLSFWRRPWWSKNKPCPQWPELSDSSVVDDGTNLHRPLRPSNELMLRCTEFDEKGRCTLIGEFKKTELIAKYGLLPRDLRKIDSSVLPRIVVRPTAILLNLLHLRVLIMHDRVLTFDVYGSTDSLAQSSFMYELEGKLKYQGDSRQPSSLPYEFRALETVLLSVTTNLESEFDSVREPVVTVLRDLEEDIDRDKLRHLLIYSKRLGTFSQRARLVRDALEELLEADDDLAAMYLTEKANGKERSEDDHTEVEMLLESYHKFCDEIVQSAENLVSNIRNTEEIVKAILDANRNSLMLLDLKFSIGTIGLGTGTFIAALYGMNLKNFYEESDLGFGTVSAACFFLTVAVCVYGLKKLTKVQRVSMWGGQGREGRGNWALDGPTNGRLARKRLTASERMAERAEKERHAQHVRSAMRRRIAHATKKQLYPEATEHKAGRTDVG
ncbi:hypothetical protein BDY21DRAFT_352415 [Lineolata rhizophorae]|uniref:Magnesium transporter n=1 Tax=Lineolata rhizophorae TaxID=578093 RepID=A0A6A6NTS4_9PEZI|nr:hypothetical protein BDY21DRAFT_352415 [Lineolata rhizophorae]